MYWSVDGNPNRLTNMTSCIGKTIRRVHDGLFFESQTGILFTDGTFLLVTVGSDCDDGPYLTFSASYTLDDDVAIAIGLTTAEESRARYEKEKLEREQKREMDEKRILENLITKYPDFAKRITNAEQSPAPGHKRRGPGWQDD